MYSLPLVAWQQQLERLMWQETMSFLPYLASPKAILRDKACKGISDGIDEQVMVSEHLCSLSRITPYLDSIFSEPYSSLLLLPLEPKYNQPHIPFLCFKRKDMEATPEEETYIETRRIYFH